MIPLLYVASQQQRAQTWSRWCDLTLIDASFLKETLASDRSEPLLLLDQLGLALLMPGYRDPYRLPQQQVHRRAKTGRPGELARACGLPHAIPSVLDACAGFGTDGLTLAALGCSVTMVEQHPMVWLLLHDLSQNLDGVIAEQGNCLDFMRGEERWDVVYLDPMFAPRRKNALPGRGLQHLRELTSSMIERNPEELSELIDIARHCALHRVVVKRRLKDPQVPQAAFQIKGKSIRFDVYLPA
jgi:16S rRNA (guanine1516-N2)-methyltransferase